MSSLAEILEPRHVNLVLPATNRADAIEQVMAKLNGDPRVNDFSVMREVVLAHEIPAIAEDGHGICIAHGRTDAVSTLVMSAGRTVQDIACPEIDSPVRLFFVIGIPIAFNSEYLRLVGAIARICRDHRQIEKLLQTKDPAQFVAMLAAGEVKL